MGCVEEFKSLNFAIYAQWLGLLSIIFLIVFGILSFLQNIIFAILAWVIAFVLVFVEIPLCTKVCPTSPKFDQFVKQFKNNWVRTVGYLAFASIMFVSVVINTTSLIAPGITLFFSGACYGIAALKHQPPAASTITGGNGISISSVSAIGRTLV